MLRPRVPSEPSYSTGAEHYNNQTFTQPAQIPRKLRSAEPFITISASMLLGLDVSHSGWVRKEGFGYRSWKSRFMVLHHGCLYYFKETDSSTPKGKFSLNGYRCYPAPDREKADRYPYVFKLVPDDEELRVYYISSPSKIEMEGWMNSITNDIQKYCPSEYDYVDTCGLGRSSTSPTVPENIPPVHQRGPGGSYVSNSLPHSFPGRYSNFLDKPPPLSPPQPEGLVQTDDPNTDDQDFYETVDPLSFEQDHYLPVLPTDETDSGNGYSTTKQNRLPRPTNGRPVPPVRPKPPPRPPDMQEDSESDGEDSDEDAWYVPIKTAGVTHRPSSPRKNGPCPTSSETGRPIPLPPEQNGPDRPVSEEVDVTYLAVLGSAEFENILKDKNINSESEQINQPKQPKPPPRSSPKPPPRNRRLSDADALGKKEFDYLPPGCFKPELPKNRAKVFLELGRTVGEYVINASQTSDTKMSLSVWLGTGVKHYLIFKRQEMFTLDPSLTDEHFKGLRDLVKYYYDHPLPKSGKYLTAPFSSSQCLTSA